MAETPSSQTASEGHAQSSAASGDPASASQQAPIVAQRLCKYYGQFTAIEQVSFEIPRGVITAFLGPNGAGKSTTMRILTGFLAPSSGKAFVGGHDMAHERIAASRMLGYLPENGPLYHDMTPASFLRFVASVRSMSGGDVSAALDRVVEACRLHEVWHKPIRKLSKGFRQRVGLAQAILHDPSVLIMDEPTSGLDPNQIELVRQLIRDLAKEKTILLSTHILQEVEAIADRVLLISEGRVRFDGAPAEMAGEQSLEQRFHELTKGVVA